MLSTTEEKGANSSTPSAAAELGEGERNESPANDEAGDAAAAEAAADAAVALVVTAGNASSGDGDIIGDVAPYEDA